MAKSIGRLIDVWVAKEGTRGTLETTGGAWIQNATLTYNDDVQYTDLTGSAGNIWDSTDSEIMTKVVRIGFEFDAYDEMMGFPLVAMFGKDATVTGTGPYTHTWTGNQNDNTHQSFTIGIKGLDTAEAINGCMLESITYTQEIDQPLRIATVWVGRTRATGATLPAVAYNSSQKVFKPQDASFAAATTYAGLAGSPTEYCVQSASVTITKNLMEQRCFGDVAPNDIHNTQFTVEGNVTAVWDTTVTAWRGWHEDGTAMATQLKWLNTGRTLTATGNPTHILRLARVKFQTREPDFVMDDLILQNVSFKGHYSLSDSVGIFSSLLVDTVSY